MNSEYTNLDIFRNWILNSTWNLERERERKIPAGGKGNEKCHKGRGKGGEKRSQVRGVMGRKRRERENILVRERGFCFIFASLYTSCFFTRWHAVILIRVRILTCPVKFVTKHEGPLFYNNIEINYILVGLIKNI